MKDFSKIDANFKVEPTLNKDGISFYDINNPPFKICGVYFDDGQFRRMPKAVAETVSEGVLYLHANTAGGRVRFKTDSPFLAIDTTVLNPCRMSIFTLTGTAGYDIYADGEYVNTFIPPYDFNEDYEGFVDLGEPKEREITVNFPLYSDVSRVFIGVKEGSTLCEPSTYKSDKKIVYYGSSITQGGCASRPGNAYQSIISRRFDVDYLNLGFSGNAKAEDEIVDYIKDLQMDIFVMDYDHNAPTTEHLKNTHEKMFLALREVHPDMPIIIMSRPKFTLNDDEKVRREIVKTTFDNAKDRGDNNVYFLDGKDLMAIAGNDGVVDGCHPTDLGFFSMAKAVGDVLEEIL